MNEPIKKKGEIQSPNPEKSNQLKIFGKEVSRQQLIIAMLLVLAVQGTLVRLIIPIQVNPSSWLITDPLRHWEHATAAPVFAPMRAIDPVMYQVFLSAVVRIVGDGAIRLALYTGILSAVTPWLYYLWLKELLPGRPFLALAGLLLICWLPSWIGIFSYFMTETLLLPLMGLSLWFTWRAMRADSAGNCALAVTAWLLTCMTRVVALPAFILSAVWLLRDRTSRTKRLVLLVVLSLVLLAPAALRSYQIIGIASPFGVPVVNSVYLLSGKKSVEVTFLKEDGQRKDIRFFESPSFKIDTFAPFWHWTTWREGTLRLNVDLDKGAADGLASALSSNMPDPQKAMRILLETNAYTWFAPSWPDETRRDFWFFDPSWLRWIWAPLAVAVVAANTRYSFIHRRIELLPLIVIVMVFAITFFPSAVGEGRYRKPLEGLLIANVLFLIANWRRPVEPALADGDEAQQ